MIEKHKKTIITPVTKKLDLAALSRSVTSSIPTESGVLPLPLP